MATVAADPVVKFHLSLNVADIDRAVAFYRVLFGQEPAKQHDDYAKFEVEEPPVILSLVPRRPGPGGSLSHVGLRVADAETVGRYRARLEAAGIGTQAQNGTVCGYARQNKVWAQDPDGTFWEVYVVEEDVLPEAVRMSLSGPAARRAPPPGPLVWEHYVTEPFTGRIAHADGTVDEVRLTGTFNAALDEGELDALLREAVRVLKPGGKVVTHGLMADRPLPGASPRLPGLAALVARVPVHTEPIDRFRAAGLVGIQAVKFTEQAWFTHEGVEMREVKYVAWKPEAPGVGGARHVLYRGPFRQARVDGGYVFPRGRRVSVPLAVWEQLRLGPTADHFLFLDAAGTACPTC